MPLKVGERPRIGWVHVAALCAVSAVLVTGYFLCASRLAASPGAREIGLKYPGAVAAGPDGSLAISDSGDRRLIVLAPDGGLAYAGKGGRRSGGFYAAKPVGFGPGGRLVLADSVANVETSNTCRDSILLLTPEGRLERTLYARDYSAEEEADYTRHMIYIQANEDFVSWFLPDPDGTWALHVLPFGAEGELEPRRFEGFDLYSTVDVVLTSREDAYILLRDGSILHRAGSGSLDAWFDNSGGAIRFPQAIAADAHGGILVLDGKRSVLSVAPPGPGSRVSVILDRDIALRSGYARQFELASLAVGKDGSINGQDEATGEVLSYVPGGSIKAFSYVPLRGRAAVLAIATVAFGGLGAVALLALLVLFYVKILGTKNPLFLRQLAIFVPVLVIASAAIALFVFDGMNASLQEELRHRLELVAQVVAGRTDAAALDRIDVSRGRLSDILGSGDYAALERVLAESVNGNQDPWNSEVSPNYYILRDGEWYIIGTIGFVELYPDAWSKPEFARVLEGGETLYTRYADVYGQWLSAMTPVRREGGGIAGVVEVTMSADILAEARTSAYRRLALGTGGLVLLVVLVFAAFDWILLASVKELKRGAEYVAAGDYDVQVDIRSRDEIEELGDAFNTMSSEIKGYVDRLASLGRANARFVPQEFLVQLGRESITEVGLGDQVLTEMTVLFSDIRQFTSLSEAMGPAGTMDLLNDYLALMGPAVREKGGFIDKYVGDSIMALFPRSPDDATAAAFAMMEALSSFNEDLAARNERPVDAGIGIHVGRLMLGVIGEAERFEGTVIADAVNLASRLESLTKFYGVKAIVRGSVRDRAQVEDGSIRFIDLVRVKGKSQVVRIYELVGALDPERKGKLGGAGTYVRAFTLYRNGQFGQAAEGFAEFLDRCPRDRPASLLRDRCLRFAAEGTPRDWEGVTEFHDK